MLKTVDAINASKTEVAHIDRQLKGKVQKEFKARLAKVRPSTRLLKPSPWPVPEPAKQGDGACRHFERCSG